MAAFVLFSTEKVSLTNYSSIQESSCTYVRRSDHAWIPELQKLLFVKTWAFLFSPCHSLTLILSFFLSFFCLCLSLFFLHTAQTHLLPCPQGRRKPLVFILGADLACLLTILPFPLQRSVSVEMLPQLRKGLSAAIRSKRKKSKTKQKKNKVLLSAFKFDIFIQQPDSLQHWNKPT